MACTILNENVIDKRWPSSIDSKQKTVATFNASKVPRNFFQKIKRGNSLCNKIKWTVLRLKLQTVH